jgi:hypothetical protein
MSQLRQGTLSSLLVLALVGLGGATAAVGCGDLTLGSSMSNATEPAGGNPYSPSDASVGLDAGTVVMGPPDATATLWVGSPLCGIVSGEPPACDPDRRYVPDAGPPSALCQAELATTTDSGTPEPMDAGAITDIGCHVTPQSQSLGDVDAGVGAPECTIAGRGTDGDNCATGTDCAPGFECVGAVGAGTSGQCRRYCCDELCPGDGLDAGTAPWTFCDIQPLTEYPGHSVPVCMPGQTCTLFQPASAPQCPPGESCTVVDSLGMTSCVASGSEGAGQSCEMEHCMAGFACWGISGHRTCQQLCVPNDPNHGCPGYQTCSTNGVNLQGTIGFCTSSGM